MRDMLMELIQNAPRTDIVYGDIKLSEPVQTLQTIVDHLLANGVIVQANGEWEDIYKGKYANALYKCSHCGGAAHIEWTGKWVLTPFCHHCGAKMVAEEALAEREGKG